MSLHDFCECGHLPYLVRCRNNQLWVARCECPKYSKEFPNPKQAIADWKQTYNSKHVLNKNYESCVDI